MVSGTAYDHLQGKLDFPLEFAGEQRVKNINRPVRTYRARLDGGAPTRWRPCRCARCGRCRRPLAARGRWLVGLVDLVSAANASIAVLPFDNLGGDEATGRLADGITEDIITELTRFRALDVIAREATAAYKGKPVDIRESASGCASFTSSMGHPAAGRPGPRDGAAGRRRQCARDVWSERWDRPTEDLFAVQSELAEPWRARSRAPIPARSPPPTATPAKRKPPNSLTAYDLYLLGMEAQERANRGGPRGGDPLLQKSLAIDPDLRPRLDRPRGDLRRPRRDDRLSRRSAGGPRGGGAQGGRARSGRCRRRTRPWPRTTWTRATRRGPRPSSTRR